MNRQLCGFASSFIPSLTRNHRFATLPRQPWIQTPQTKNLPNTLIVAMAPRRMPAVIRPVVPSPKLQDFVEDKAQSRSVILKILHEYVKEHNLQDPSDKKKVRCDRKLKDLLGVDECTILEISKYISPHLKKPEDVGGRYVSEAEVIEKEYIERKALEEQLEQSEGGAPKQKRTRRNKRGKTDQEKKTTKRTFKPVLLSDDLSAVCRSQKELTRPEIIKAVWDYIRLNNLQKEPGQPVQCDFLLRKVYQSENIDSKGIMKGISAHVRPKN